MDIYGSYLAEEESGNNASQKSAATASTSGSKSVTADTNLSAVYPVVSHGEDTDEHTTPTEDTVDRAAIISAPPEDAVDYPAVPPPAVPARSKPNFSVLSNYKWGTYAAGDALLSDEPIEVDLEDQGEEVECMLDGEDDIVLLADSMELAPAPVREQPLRFAGLGLGIYSMANNTTKKAGDVIYYAANSVGETGNKMLIEAKATLSRTSDIAIVSVAGGAAAETLMFAVDRSKLLGHRFVNSLQGDPEISRRMHLRRLLASGSWAEFSAKCQLATLPWYARQLIHLTRYDAINNPEPEVVSRTQKLNSENNKAKAKKKVNQAATKSSSATESPAPPNALTYPGRPRRERMASADAEDPTQLDTLILSPDEVDYLNSLTKHEASVAQDQKEESSTLTDSEFHDWILSRAKAGSADAEYALCKWFTPPGFTESNACYECKALFSISKFRHHCRHCGRSFCGDHSSETRSILKYGFASPVRVCDACACVIDRESRMDRQRWKRERLEDYMHNSVIPYFEVAEDRGVDKAYRLGLGTLHVVRNMGMALTYPALVAAEALEILRKYGLVGLAGILLRNDFMEAVEALKQITSMDERYPLSIRQLTACIYYKLAIERGLRGCDPDGELRAHVACPDSRWRQISGPKTATSSAGAYVSAQEEADRHSARLCKQVDDVVLNEFIQYASIALLISYEENSVECQRLAELQGYQTLISDPSSEPERPAYAVFVCNGNPTAESSSGHAHPQRKREAILAIRGTHTIQDVVTDLRAVPIVFPPNKDEIDGIMNGSVWVHRSGREPGRPQAGGSAPPAPEDSPRTAAMKVYAEEVYITEEVGWHAPVADVEYACRGPARAALNILTEVGPTLVKLAQEGHEIRIVGHSLGGAVSSLLALLLKDFIPSVKALAFSPPCFLSAGLAEKMEPLVHSCVLHDDIICRVSPESIRLLMKELIVFRDKVFKFVEQDWYDAIKRAGSIWTPRWRDSRSYIPTTSQSKYTAPMQKTKYTSRAPATNNMIHGGIGTVVVGEDDMVLVRQGKAVSQGNAEKQRVQLNALDFISDITTSQAPAESRRGTAPAGGVDSDDEEDDIFFNEHGDSDRAVIIGDTVVAKLHVPGRVFHIYSHRGVYRISEVPKTFPSLNRIEIQGDIFNDHRSSSVYDALLEVRSVRAAKCTPPPWTPFDASAICQCCKSSFTWHTTCQGDAQELRERYNCVCCGKLVCGPCSSHALPIPRLGLTSPTRVCDSCFHLGYHTSPNNP